MVMNHSYAILYIKRKRWARNAQAHIHRAWARYHDLSEKIYIPARVLTMKNVLDGKVYVRHLCFFATNTWPALYFKRKKWKTANSWILSIR